MPWARGTTNPLADGSDNLGQSLLPLTTPLANAWCLIVGGVLVVAGIAAVGCVCPAPRGWLGERWSPGRSVDS